MDLQKTKELKTKEKELNSYIEEYLVDVIKIGAEALKGSHSISELRAVSKKVSDKLYSLDNTINSLERITRKLPSTRSKGYYIPPGTEDDFGS